MGESLFENTAVYFTGCYVPGKLSDKYRGDKSNPGFIIKYSVEIIFFNMNGINRTNTHAFTAVNTTLRNKAGLSLLHPECFGGAGLNAMGTPYANFLLYIKRMMEGHDQLSIDII
jgi:hypothetical protein